MTSKTAEFRSRGQDGTLEDYKTDCNLKTLQKVRAMAAKYDCADSVDLSAAHDGKDRGGRGAEPTDASPATPAAEAGELSAAAGPVQCRLRPGSETLMESLEQKRRNGAERRPLKGLTIPDVEPRPQPLLATGGPARPLPRALQPKEIRRSPQPVSPTPGSVYTSGAPLSAGVNVSDSVLRQQRRRSSSEFSTSPTAVPPSAAGPSPTRDSAKPEVVFERPEVERGSSVGGRRVVCEANPGLPTLRATQLRHVTRETTRRPRVEVSSVNRHESKSFADILAVFQTPSSTTIKVKSPSYNQSPSVSSKFNKSEFDEPPNIVTAELTVDSASVSNAVFDPSPTISKMLRSQHSRDVGRSQKRPETQPSCPETVPTTSKPIIEIRESIASPTEKQENSGDLSTNATTTDPTESHPGSAGSYSSSSGEFSLGQPSLSDADYDWSDCKVEVIEKSADAGDDDEDAGAAVATGGPGDAECSETVHLADPPPLPSSQPPPVSTPRDATVKQPDGRDYDDQYR